MKVVLASKGYAGLHPKALGSNQSRPASHRNQPPLCPLNGTVEAYHVPPTSPSRTNPPDESLYAPPSVRPTRRGLAFTNRAPHQQPVSRGQPAADEDGKGIVWGTHH
ncbi:hypothetical protein HYPSUDRAFT_209939 [Hypholoma sublateritium FD-334 SS-4]|uniref:Uncharacterized protein n=1 Tax=Hypholoma sublateritium (strain FD-334 SS-4) TaxID=945553 RepID=A0A0D2N884_HYPSF|nr:hypothetical protein HYPSUDRAFT_209939 [Hypholoma sublateritium FD-334 SS-4]